MDTRTEAIWEEFSSALKQFILAKVGDEQTAEDILQDVFVKIHTRIDTLNDESKLQSWIYQIARNAINDHYRKPPLNQPLDETLPAPVPDDDTEKRLARSVRGMVDQLPQEYREVIVLTAFEGVSQKDAGERLGLSFSGAKSRVQRARGKLRDMFLDCCHFEFDRLGGVVNYHPRADCCKHCSDKAESAAQNAQDAAPVMPRTERA